MAKPSTAISIETLDQYIHWVDQNCYSSTVFRGQGHDWDPMPKIARSDHRDAPRVERDEFSMFKRYATSLSLPMQRDDLDWMCTAQHYGLATRLLDWTHNPLVALWFAVVGGVVEGRKPVVYAHDPKMFDAIDAGDDSHIQDPFKYRSVALVLPKMLNDRVRAQSGCFTLHPWNDREMRYRSFGDAGNHSLRSVYVEATRASTILKSLRQAGVHEFSLYPDPAGLAQYIAEMSTPPRQPIAGSSFAPVTEPKPEKPRAKMGSGR